MPSPRFTGQPSDYLFYSLSSHIPLNFYSHSPLLLRPIILSPFSLLSFVSHLPLLLSSLAIYLTKLTALPHKMPHHKPSHPLTVQSSNHLFRLLYHTPLNSYYHSPSMQRPIIFTPFNSQNPGFTKNTTCVSRHTTYNIRHTKLFVRNYHKIMQNKPKVKYAQINVTSFIRSKYVKMDIWLSGKNKPNQTQNKANPQNAQNECKINYNKGL